MFTGIIGMGMMLSFIIDVGYGTDSCSFMNLSFSNRFGLSLGTCMLLTNLVLFVPEVLWGRKLIGLGTITNMTLIGYTSDICRALIARYLPTFIFSQQPYRTLIFVLALIPFLIFASCYMNADMGQAPYDAIPTILSQKLPLPYAPIRMAWDFLAIAMGILSGGKLTPATVVLSLTIGPSVTFFGKLIFRKSEPSKS